MRASSGAERTSQRTVTPSSATSHTCLGSPVTDGRSAAWKRNRSSNSCNASTTAPARNASAAARRPASEATNHVATQPATATVHARMPSDETRPVYQPVPV